MAAAVYDNWVGLAIGIALVALLAVVLIAPERFCGARRPSSRSSC